MTGDSTANHPGMADHLFNRPITSRERAWITFIRLASGDSDPAPTLERIQRLQIIFSETRRQ
jgi:hypothetical protein